MEQFHEARLQVEFSDLVEGLPAPETFPAGTVLVEQNGQVPWVGVVASGIVRLGMIDAEKKDRLLGLRSQGWWLASEAVVLPLPSLMNVTALTDVQLIRMPLSRFAQLLHETPLLTLHVLRSQMTEKLQARIGLSGSIGTRPGRHPEPRPNGRLSEDEGDSVLA